MHALEVGNYSASWAEANHQYCIWNQWIWVILVLIRCHYCFIRVSTDSGNSRLAALSLWHFHEKQTAKHQKVTITTQKFNKRAKNRITWHVLFKTWDFWYGNCTWFHKITSFLILHCHKGSSNNILTTHTKLSHLRVMSFISLEKINKSA